MKRLFVSIFLLSMAIAAFSQVNKTWTIEPRLNDHSYEDAVSLAEDGDETFEELVNKYKELKPALKKEIDSRLMDSIYEEYDSKTLKDFTIKLDIKKKDKVSFRYEALLEERSVIKSEIAGSEEKKTEEIAKQLANQLCPFPIPGSISLFRVDGKANVFWSASNTDVKNDTLEYMMLRSPSKTNLMNKNTAIRLARQESKKWKTVASGGYFEEYVDLANESAKQSYFTVVVRNSLGCYSVYDVKGCQRIAVSTYLPGTVVLSATDSRYEEFEYYVDIGLEETRNIMLSDGSWKIKINYDDGFESKEKSIEVQSSKTNNVEVAFDDLSKDFVESKYKQGMESKKNGRTDDAVKALTLAADNKTFPHADAMYQLGVIYEEKKDSQKALNYYTKADEYGSSSARNRLNEIKREEADSLAHSYKLEDLRKAEKIYEELGDREKASEVSKRWVDEFEYKKEREKEREFLTSQRHRTIITPLAFGVGLPLLTEKDDSSLPSPLATLNMSINATFGIWPNVFVGFSTVFDIYGSLNSEYDYFGTSILGTIGFNYTIWHHINLFVLAGGGCEFLNENISSHEVWDENSHSYHYYQSEENKYVNSRLRAGIGFDWWFVYDDDDDWVFLDKIGMTFEYDMDYYFDSSQKHGNRLDGTFKLGFTFFWDTEGTAGFMPSFYNY